MIGTLHQQAAEVDVACFSDTELRLSLSGLTSFRPQAEIATHIATSLETFFVSQSLRCLIIIDPVDNPRLYDLMSMIVT